MIPKIIHYCWLSNDPFPPIIQKCIDSWTRYMPTYTLKRWSTENFDIHSVPLVEQAYNAKKYAFAADYIRCYALYKEGGVYLDSDVMVYKNFEELLENYDYVTGTEFHPSSLRLYKSQVDYNYKRKASVNSVEGVGLQAAFMASIPCHPFLEKCLSVYCDLDLDTVISHHQLAPIIQAQVAEIFGFRYVNEKQMLDKNILILPTSVIGQSKIEKRNRYLTHMGEGSWVNRSLKNRIIHLFDGIGIYRKYMKMKDLLGLIK